MATRNNKKIIASALIIGLLVFLIFAMLPYIRAIFGALIFYVLFQPMYRWLLKKKISKSWAALTVILSSILIILIPVLIVISLLLGEVSTVVEGARGFVDDIATLDEVVANINLEEMANEVLTKGGQFIQNVVWGGVNAATQLLISVTIMYFLLYFMFVNSRSIKKAVESIIPFKKKNTERLYQEASNVTNSVIISTGLVALIQGTMVGLGFWVAGIPGAVLWGVIATALSFLPVVGTPIIWGPAVIILLVQGNYFAGIGLLIWGIIISTSDNFLRPMIQQKVAEIHPLISVVGVFIGIPYFGILGLIIGPLILSYLVLTIQMFEEEYL